MSSFKEFIDKNKDSSTKNLPESDTSLSAITNSLTLLAVALLKTPVGILKLSILLVSKPIKGSAEFFLKIFIIYSKAKTEYNDTQKNSSKYQPSIAEKNNLDKKIKELNALKTIEKYINLANINFNNGSRIVRSYFSSDVSVSQLEAFNELEKGLNLIKEGITLSTADSSKYKEAFTYFETAHVHLEGAIRLAVVSRYTNGGNTPGGGDNNFGGRGGNRGQGRRGSGFGNEGGGFGNGGNSGGSGFDGYFPDDDDPFKYFKIFLRWVVDIIDSKSALVKDAITDIHKTTITNLFTSISTVFSRISVSLYGKITQLVNEDDLATKSEEDIDKATQIANFTEIALKIAEDTKKITELLNESANKNSAFSVLIGEFKGEMNITSNQREVSVGACIKSNINHLQGDNNKVDQGENNQQRVSNKTSNFNQQNAQFGGGLVNADTVTAHQIGGNITNYNPEQKQNLAQAAAEIQQLLNQLSQSYPTATTSQKMSVVAKAVDEIESDPTLKARVIGALKAGGTEAFKELIDNPLVNILLASIEGWQEVE
jgi:hypothetical protein